MNFLALVSLLFVNICLGFTFSMLNPFFPQEASSRGATASEYSPVVGIPSAAMLISSPLLGRFMRQVGTIRVLKIGIILVCLDVILFGFINFVDSPSGFLSLAYLLRVPLGVGSAAMWISTLSLLLSYYPDKSAGVYSLVDATWGLGCMTGPVIGGFLYNMGGFLLPFIVVGHLIAVSGIIAIIINQKCFVEEAESQQDSTNNKQIHHQQKMKRIKLSTSIFPLQVPTAKHW